VGFAGSKELGGETAIGGAVAVLLFVVYVGFLFGAQLAAVFILSGLEHFVLRISGERELGPFTVTLRAHALGLSPYVVGLIPLCGPTVMGLWSLVTRVLSLMALQRVSGGKAAAAVFAPVVAGCMCALIGWVAFAAIIAGVAATTH